MLCISTSECMLAHAFTWSKPMKNAQKLSNSTFFSVFHCFRQCECMRKHAFAGENTQQ